jgi:hypothetical protein
MLLKNRIDVSYYTMIEKGTGTILFKIASVPQYHYYP